MPASSASAPVRPREVRDKRGHCTLEKAHYVASRTQTAHNARLNSVHVGIFCGLESLGNSGQGQRAFVPRPEHPGHMVTHGF